MIDKYFEICDFPWRGLGEIPKSGMKLRPQYAQRLLLILELGLLILTLHDNARRYVRDANRRFRAVDVLPACSRGTVGIDAQIAAGER